MTKLNLFLSFFILLISTLSFSQDILLLKYWPIEPGNFWCWVLECNDDPIMNTYFYLFIEIPKFEDIYSLPLFFDIPESCVGQDPFGINQLYPNIDLSLFAISFRPAQIFASIPNFNEEILLADFSVEENDSFYCGGPNKLWIKVMSQDSIVMGYQHCVVFSNGAAYAPHIGPINYLGGYFINETIAPNVKEQNPESFTLAQNYPNPFNSETVIEFNLPQFSEIELAV